MRRHPFTSLALVGALLALPSADAQEEGVPEAVVQESVVLVDVADGLRQLREVAKRLDEAGQEIDRIRETPGFAEEYGREPPPELERYLALTEEVSALGSLEARLRAALREVAAVDRAGLVRALSTETDPLLLDACGEAAPEGDPEVAKALLACARRASPVPAGIRGALARTRDPEAATLLVDLGVREKDSGTLLLALQADPERLNAVLDAAGHADPGIAEAARVALSELDVAQGPDLDTVRDRIRGVVDRAPQLSAEARCAAVGLIARHAARAPWNEPEEVRAELMHAVADALSQLNGADQPEAVRSAIAIGAASIEGQVGLDLLLDLASDPAPRVRSAAAFALGRTRQRAAIPALADLLEDDEVDHGLVVKALVAIAGRDHGGSDPDAWRRWWSRQAGE